MLIREQFLVTLRRRLVAFVARFTDDDSAATAIEYGLILTGISVFILIAVFAVGDALENFFTAVQTKLAEVQPS